MKVYAASTNQGKLQEFGAEALPGLKQIPPPEETGDTFAENAAIKAAYYSRHLPGELVIADDSGLSVDALGGAPGVHSARYAGVDGDAEANKQKLLRAMDGIENRAAKFVCVIALAKDGEVLATFEGEVRGEILREARGTGGFGYDPLFYYPPLGVTFAEASAEQKHSVSHRGRALRKLHEFLESSAF